MTIYVRNSSWYSGTLEGNGGNSSSGEATVTFVGVGLGEEPNINTGSVEHGNEIEGTLSLTGREGNGG